MLSRFVISLVAANCQDSVQDEVCVLQTKQGSKESELTAAEVQRKKSRAEGIDESLAVGPDDDGLCNWSSVFGADVPTNTSDVKDLVRDTCEGTYQPELCSDVSDELFRGLSGQFSAEMETHHEFCRSLTELILASFSHMRDLDEKPTDEWDEPTNDHWRLALNERALILGRRTDDFDGAAVQKSPVPTPPPPPPRTTAAPSAAARQAEIGHNGMMRDPVTGEWVHMR